MPQPANILSGCSTPTQAPIGPSATPPTIPRNPASPTGTFRYTSVEWASDRIDAVKRDRGRTVRGSAHAALKLYKALKRRADRHGHVRISNDQLARALHMKDRHTVCAAAHLLVDAGLIDLPARTHDRRGYVDGLDYTLRFDAAYGATVRQQDLPLKSSTKSSSAPSAPPRPLTPATMKFTQVAAWEVTNAHLAATARGEDVPDMPDNAPDVAQAVRDWLTEHGATAAEADIRAALDHVAHQRRRQQALPLIGVVTRGHRHQTAARTTIRGAADRSTVAAWSQLWTSAPVSTEERDRRREAEEQLRAEVVAAVEAQPPDAAAALRSAVRPELDAHMRRCPGLTDRDRPKLEHDAIVVAVLQELRGRSIAETIAALIADVSSESGPATPVEAAPDVAAHLADLRRRLAG